MFSTFLVFLSALFTSLLDMFRGVFCSKELKREFENESPGFVLAAAISGYKEVIDVAYDIPTLSRHLDFMSVMTYDYHGSWERETGHVSPLYGSPSDKYNQYNSVSDSSWTSHRI